MSPYAPLAVLLDQLAIQTWDLVHHSQTHGVALREDALTSINMIRLRAAALPNFMLQTFSAAEEVQNGADFEWWIGSNRSGWLGLRVQAKRGYGRKYPHIRYTPKGSTTQQCDTLIQQTRADARRRALYPMYCFYNGWDDGTAGWPAKLPWNHGCARPPRCAFVPDVRVFGCGLVHAAEVHAVLGKRVRRWPKLLPLQIPWSWLFHDPINAPRHPVSLTARDVQRYLLGQRGTAGDDADLPTLYSRLPEYVRASMDGIRGNEPAPARWFMVTGIDEVALRDDPVDLADDPRREWS